MDGHPKGLQVNLKNIMDHTFLATHRISTDDVSNQQSTAFTLIVVSSLPGGELGPTMKVKRQAVTKKYEGGLYFSRLNNFLVEFI